MVFATGERCLAFLVNSAGWAGACSVYLLVMAVGGQTLLWWWLVQPNEIYMSFKNENSLQRKNNHASQSLMPLVPPGILSVSLPGVSWRPVYD